MGSLCQSKPAVSNTNSTQTYTPAGQSGMQDIYSRVKDAASTPYNPYTGQLVANLDPVTQSGISNVNSAYGMAQPYYNQAAQYAQAGAAAITPDQIAAYQNPYQQQVIDATRANMNENNAQQQSQLRGNAALKGALGGDRAGVAGAELARQQKLAQDPVIAQMYSQGYDKSLGAAQADRAAQAQGAFTYGSLGGASQNAALQGAQAQIGAGAVSQQNQQQKLGADYQQYLNAQAFPYQQAQFLASYGMPALTGQGGTTAGQQQKTEQAAQASPFSQALGVGLTAAGLFTGNPFMAMGGAGSLFGGGGGGGGWANGSAPQGTGANLGGYGGSFNADGGRILARASGGKVPLPRERPYTWQERMIQEDPFLQYPKDAGMQTGMRDLSSMTENFGVPWRKVEPENFNLTEKLYNLLPESSHEDANSRLWDRLKEQGVVPLPVGVTGNADAYKDPSKMPLNQRYPNGPQLGGFADGGFVDTVKSIRSALRQCYDEGGVVKPLDLYRGAIGNMESSGRYDAMGPVIAKTGDRAYGRYGVMGANIPQWSRAALGKEVSPEEFLKSQDIQDKVFNHRFGTYVDKYGPQGAARAWFAGPGNMNNMNASDAQPGFRGNTVAQYEGKFNKALGVPDADRARLASMSGAGDQPEGRTDPYASNGSVSVSPFSDPARRRAIALGLAMATGGGGGFASGGEVGGSSIVPKAIADTFESRWGRFPGEPLPGISPNQRVQESHGVNGPMDDPSAYMKMGKEALGQQPNSPYQLNPQNDWPENAERQGPPEAPQMETAEGGESPSDEISSQRANGRMDPYSVYQQNRPEGGSGDDLRSALMAAGLGMLAGKSSNALTNIGEGGLKGLTQYNINKKERQSADLAARRLMQQAEQFNQSLDLKNDQYNRQSENDARKEAMFDRRLQQQERMAREREERGAAREQWKPIGADTEGNPILLNQKDGTTKVVPALNMAQKPSEEQKLTVKNDLKRLDEVRNEAKESEEMIESSKRALAALPKASTGVTGGLTPGWAADEATQALRSEVNKMTLERGQKMKGSFSDKDILFLKEMMGGRFASAEVLQQGFEGIQAAAARQQTRVDFYEQYRARNKSLQGVDNAWNHYLAANPVIQKDPAAATGYKVNADNARADYSVFVRPVPSWVPKGAKNWNDETREYVDENGKLKKLKEAQ